jgi:hypothetical protein
MAFPYATRQRKTRPDQDGCENRLPLQEPALIGFRWCAAKLTATRRFIIPIVVDDVNSVWNPNPDFKGTQANPQIDNRWFLKLYCMHCMKNVA